MSAKQPQVAVRRVYDDASADDGYRVLVDRVWPRGLRRDDARLDEWCKAVAPSTELRRWYGHDPDRHAEFVERYRAELRGEEQAGELARLRERATAGRLTLLTATRDVDLSNAAALADVLREPAGH